MRPLGFLSALTYLLIKTAIQVALELFRFGLCLLLWSIRAYGWGKVLTFGIALGTSAWMHIHLGLFRGQVPVGVALAVSAAGTALLWGSLVLVLNRLRPQQRPFQEPFVPFPSSPSQPSQVSRGSPSSFSSLLPRWRSVASRFPLRRRSLLEGTELWEQVIALETLRRAWQRVLLRGGGPGPDGVTVEAFSLNAEQNLAQLQDRLQSGRYVPRPPRWVEVPKPSGGTRRLGVLCVEDRIVQQALLLTLVPRWDPKFAPCSYAYRPGRSAQQAVTAVEEALAQGRVWVVDADIESFFDSVPHAPLLAQLADEGEGWLPDADARVRELLQRCLKATAPARGRGLAQGAPLSPLLANLYLHPFDRALSEAGYRLVRYADDFVVLCATRSEAEQALQRTRQLLEGLDLHLHPEKTRIVHRDEGFTFLGWVFDREGKRPSPEAFERLYGRLAAAPDAQSRRQIVAGWQGYFGPEFDWELEVALAPDFNGSDGEAEPVESSLLKQYRRLFLGRSDVFARFWQKGNRQGYAPVRRSPMDEELDAHLRGEAVLGTYPLQPDGQTRLLVFDVDGSNPTDVARDRAFSVAQALYSALRQRGLVPLWFDSGGKGYHLWLPLAGPAPAVVLRRWAKRWLDAFRPFPEGVIVEVFPKQGRLSKPEALGSLIRLPLGRHPQTGRFGALLDEQGRPRPAVAAEEALASASPLDPQTLLRAEPLSVVPEPPEAVAPVVRGCALIAALVRKAAQTHHLRHTERLALLYALGPLGEEGRNFLHQVMALCSNYDPRITERWLQRLEPGHPPIRCATLREWLQDFLPDVRCPCLPGSARKNPSPLDLLQQQADALDAEVAGEGKGEEEAGFADPLPDGIEIEGEGDEAALWEEVAEELFGSNPEAEAETEDEDKDEGNGDAHTPSRRPLDDAGARGRGREEG